MVKEDKCSNCSNLLLVPCCISVCKYTLSRPVVVKQLPGPSLPKLMAQFNIDVDSGIIRISQLIYGICPGMSQATLFSIVFIAPALIGEGLVPSEIGAVYTLV